MFLTNKAFYQVRPLRFWLRPGSVGVPAPLYICHHMLCAPSHPEQSGRLCWERSLSFATLAGNAVQVEPAALLPVVC